MSHSPTSVKTRPTLSHAIAKAYGMNGSSSSNMPGSIAHCTHEVGRCERPQCGRQGTSSNSNIIRSAITVTVGIFSAGAGGTFSSDGQRDTPHAALATSPSRAAPLRHLATWRQVLRPRYANPTARRPQGDMRRGKARPQTPCDGSLSFGLYPPAYFESVLDASGRLRYYPHSLASAGRCASVRVRGVSGIGTLHRSPPSRVLSGPGSRPPTPQPGQIVAGIKSRAQPYIRAHAPLHDAPRRHIKPVP